MANILTVDGPDAVRQQEREKVIRYKCAIQAGNYVQAVRGQNVGEVLDLTKAVGVGGKENEFWGPNGPKRGYVINGPGGFAGEIIPGADALHWLLKIWASGGNEHAAGAYEAAITGDQDFLIEFTGRPFD